MAPLDINPNELEPYWVPFTPNRAFKKRPRIFSGAKGMHYFKPDGTKVEVHEDHNFHVLGIVPASRWPNIQEITERLRR